MRADCKTWPGDRCSRMRALGRNLRNLVSQNGLGPRAAMEAMAILRGSKLGLRTHLIVFGLAIVVPVLLYSAFVLHSFTESEQASNERRALGIARALSADI